MLRVILFIISFYTTWLVFTNKWCITFIEREIIEKLLKQKVSYRKIWKVIWRWKSSISDEINRYKTPAMWYEAVLAERQFHRNQQNKWNKKKIDSDNRIKQFILDWLDKDWSPEEISWRIRKFHSNSDIESYIPYICMETIYSFLYAKENNKLYLNIITKESSQYITLDFLLLSQYI